MRTDGQRADARDNRRRLLAATESLLSTRSTFSLTDLASSAGVSRATTYRNFATSAEAVTAFISDFLGEFEEAVSENGQVTASVEELCVAWGSLVEHRGAALVHVRSTEGFLARVRRDDPVIGRIYRLVRGALEQDVAGSRLASRDLDYAVFLWNLLLDPRELMDLAEHNDLSVAAATLRLTLEFRGWLDRIPGQSASLDVTAAVSPRP
jgi:AcrR family transcriptional regulator